MVAVGGVGLVVHVIPAQVRAHIGREIRVVDLETVVHDGDDLGAAATVRVPYGDDVDVLPHRPAALAGVSQMPLVREEGVVRYDPLGPGPDPVGVGDEDLAGFHELVCQGEAPHGVTCIVDVCVSGESEGMDTFEPVPLLELPDCQGWGFSWELDDDVFSEHHLRPGVCRRA